ncbi:hypothetical protein DERP_007608 [Dermatophagoides pteronyssinus]|uniref:Uncharacterized protein n=1 Tax=Dermatophagoides pteronyssinus TaxID=6956 RepID=A0ABQ8JK86_DERPT|nr:hypothetical protein DERP_007608 [Dermatophagoides pteronyssinus]
MNIFDGKIVNIYIIIDSIDDSSLSYVIKPFFPYEFRVSIHKMTANFFMMEIKNRIKIIEINETLCFFSAVLLDDADNDN